jgi:tetratricopeptide (TPR) repeat protein
MVTPNAAGAYTGNLNTARMLERFGREEDAIKYYEAARRIEPNSTLALKRLSDLYKRVGRTEESQSTENTLNGMTVSNAATSGR